jgi:hypothetical protein
VLARRESKSITSKVLLDGPGVLNASGRIRSLPSRVYSTSVEFQNKLAHSQAMA